MDDYTLVLTTGAPGSAWSMISNRFKKSMKGFDKTDETADRRYKMPEGHVNDNYVVTDDSWAQSTHNGCYFGPHHENGHGFDNIAKNYTVEEFKAECLKPYSDTARPNKLIRSHWFAYNLDWLWDNCKGHKLLLIWREPEASRDWWYSMGGWDIHYPVYTWYEGPERMWQQIQEEAKLVWEFGQKHQVEWWDFDVDNEWIYSRYPQAKRLDAKANPKINDRIKIAYVDIT